MRQEKQIPRTLGNNESPPTLACGERGAPASFPADDYESLEIITATVNEWALAEGFTPTKEQITKALQQLIGEGYAQAYFLHSHAPHVEPVAYSEER